MTDQGGPYPQTTAPAGVVHLGLGQPSPRLLPLARLGRAAVVALGPRSDPLLLQYGAATGYEGFRHALAGFLSDEEGVPVAGDELMVTGGTSMALSFVAQVFAPGGGSIVCGDPTYFLARGVFEATGASLVPVPVDREGLNVEALEGRLREGLRPVLVYCIPTFHNPTGACLAPERAERLVELADLYDFRIVADEPYSNLYFGTAPHSMVTLDRGRGRVLSLGSFSKILGPGLRLGWVRAAASVVERLARHGIVRSGGGLNPIVSALVHPLIDDGFLREHVAGLREVFRRRAETLTRALATHLPDARFEPPSGGYFVWVDVGAARVERLDRAAARRDFAVDFLPGHACGVDPELRTRLRLGFCFYEPDELERGVRRLAALLGAPTNP